MFIPGKSLQQRVVFQNVKTLHKNILDYSAKLQRLDCRASDPYADGARFVEAGPEMNDRMTEEMLQTHHLGCDSTD